MCFLLVEFFRQKAKIQKILIICIFIEKVSQVGELAGFVIVFKGFLCLILRGLGLEREFN